MENEKNEKLLSFYERNPPQEKDLVRLGGNLAKAMEHTADGTGTETEAPEDLSEHSFNPADETEAGRSEAPENETETEQEKFNGSLNAASLISPEAATDMLDNVLSFLLSFVITNYVGTPLSRADIKATAAEKKTISPILQACLEKWEFDIQNPFVALAIVLGTTYGAKALVIVGDDKLIKTTKENAGNRTAAPKKDGRGRPVGSFKKK